MPNTTAGAKTRGRVPGPDFRISPLAAHAADMALGRWAPPTPVVAGAITVAAILHAATRDRAVARKAVERAGSIARELLTPEDLRFGCTNDPVGLDGPVAAVRTLVQHVKFRENAAAALTRHILESLLALVPRDSVDRGRVLSSLVSHGYEQTGYGLRTERITEVIRLGQALRSHELMYRGWSQLAAEYLVRGNLPGMERCARKTVKHAARMGDSRAMANATGHIGVITGMRGDPAGSVKILWAAVKGADHPHLRWLLLSNLGETLYRAGHFRESRAARAVAFKLAIEVNAVSVALGGYAACCAAMGDAAGVKWAVTQATRIACTRPPSRGIAQGLMGCADACAEVGLDDLARSLHRRGHDMATSFQFHDLTFRADPTTRAKKPKLVQFGGDAAKTLDSIVELAPDGMPSDSVLVPG
jgi:hypothetical protein